MSVMSDGILIGAVIGGLGAVVEKRNETVPVPIENIPASFILERSLLFGFASGMAVYFVPQIIKKL